MARLSSFLVNFLTFSSVLSTTTGVDEYDYVIVGSGPGGGSLAANLAVSGYSVFLIEAGGDNSTNAAQLLPLLSARAAETPGHSWQFFVNHYSNTTQARRDPTYTYRLSNGSYWIGPHPPSDAVPAGNFYPRGATLGGSAQVNAMNFIWSPDNEWDYIANLTGDRTWSHHHMRQHFAALENCTYVPRGAPGHGYNGYIESSMGNTTSGIASSNIARFLSNIFRRAEGIEVDSVQEMAELLRRDINAIERERYQDALLFTTPAAISPATGSRSGVAGYINRVIAGGYPLTLSLHSLATRVLFEKRGKKPRAYGVEYMVGEGLYSADGRYNATQRGQVRTVRARREVVLSGGTFNTPQLLKLSGIGPRQELRNLSIPVLVDLPAVGNFMQDNYEAPVRIQAEQPWIPTVNNSCTYRFDENDPCFALWETQRTGPYTQRGGTFTMVWRSSVSWDRDADMLFTSTAGAGGLSGFYPGYSNLERRLRPNEWGTPIIKMQTDNPAGTVRLRSRDPRQAPEITFNYFQYREERDLQALVEGVQLLLQTFNETGIPHTVITPDPNLEMRQAIKDTAFSHHATSSCRMGPSGHRDYCVDSKFRVNGVRNLRVVDASVLPRVPGGMPNSPTFTLSRKAYETIMRGD